jgi:hypothetical protein
MKLVNVIFALIVAISLACNSNKTEDFIKIIEPIQNHVPDSSYYKLNSLAKKFDHTFNLSHINMIRIDGVVYKVILNQNHDSLIVFNSISRKIERIKLPFNMEMPISTFYFHNFDSIFVFMDRFAINDLKKYGLQLDDVVLFNSKGKVLSVYNFNSVPYIGNGQKDTLLNMSRWPISSNRLIGNKLYIPFMIFRPEMSHVKNIKIRLLCELNLQTGKTKMLNVSVPNKVFEKDIDKRVSKQDFDFYILNKDSILISFLGISDIYLYKPSIDKMQCIKSFNDYYFSNQNNFDNSSSQRITFFCPQYCEKSKLYYRNIFVSQFESYANFIIVQVLDSSFNLLGTVIEDTMWSGLMCNPQEELEVLRKKDKIGFVLRTNNNFDKSITEIKKTFLKPFKIAPIQKRKKTLIKDSYKERVSTYVASMVPNNKKYIIPIYTNMVCSECLKTISQFINTQKNTDIREKIVLLFYGSNITFAQELVEKFHIENSLCVIDFEREYQLQFNKEELNNQILIYRNGNSFKIFNYEFNNLKETLIKFVNER